jgi:hypothetical protein
LGWLLSAQSPENVLKSRLNALSAALLYTAATLVMTWPLCLGLTRDLPWDLGDSILNTFILQWDADHILSFLSGHFGALGGYWNANFFYPEPLALAYSEHLTAQALQVVPVFAVGGNVILAYNLLFLSTFVLSGLGAFLLVREWTGSPRAALVAGFLFAFTPYRVAQYSHLQVLSAQWMPFALYGFSRFFVTRRIWPLAGATAALILNNLSCGYFLLYFSPFVAAFVLWEMARRGLLGDVGTWARLAGAAVVVTCATLPFLLPYAAVRAQGFGPRSLAEVMGFSADVFAYATTHVLNRVWGATMVAFPRAEGELFMGLTPALLSLVAFAGGLIGACRRDTLGAPDRLPAVVPAWRRWTAAAAAVVGLMQVILLGMMVTTGGLVTRVAGVSVRATNPGRALLILGLAAALLLVSSHRARAAARRAWTSPVTFAALAMVAAWILSLGPRPTAMGRHIADWGPYAWLHSSVPGFDGLRVPARFAMIVALFLACLGGCGFAVLERWRRGRFPLLVVISVAILGESISLPLPLNGTSPLAGIVTPIGPLAIGAHVRPVYHAVAALPADAVLVEFPFGIEEYDLRYMVASAVHRRPILNGYSGGFPASYARHQAAFGRALSDPDVAWDSLLSSGATHALVHEDVYLNDEGRRLSRWLASHGARLVRSFGSDSLFELER